VRGFAGIDYVFGAAPEAGVAHLAVITVDGRVRDHVRLRLGERGIQTSLHYPPIHKFTAFKDGEASGLPITEQFSERAITLPLYTTLPDYAPGEIIAAVATAMQGA